MALQSIGSLLPFPEVPQAERVWNNAGIMSFLIDAVGKKFAVVFRVPKTGTLAKTWFRLATVTTGQTLKVSFQDIDLATGDPDGVVDQFRTVPVADTDDNVWKQTGLITADGTDTGAKRAVTLGDYLACVHEFDSTAGNLNFGAIIGGDRTGYVDSAYIDYYTAAWVKQTMSVPCFALEYDDGSVEPIMGALPFIPGVMIAITAGTEGGTHGKVPFKCRVKGLNFAVAHSTSTSFQLRLYASDATTILASVSVDSDVGPGRGTGLGTMGAWYFSSPITLNANDVVFVCATPTGGSLNIVDSPLASSTLWNAAPRSSDWYKVTRATAGSGAFTEATSNIVWAGLILDQLDDGAGGAGGLLVHPGMAGGMRG